MDVQDCEPTALEGWDQQANRMKGNRHTREILLKHKHKPFFSSSINFEKQSLSCPEIYIQISNYWNALTEKTKLALWSKLLSKLTWILNKAVFSSPLCREESIQITCPVISLPSNTSVSLSLHLSGEPWRLVLFTSLFWESSSRAARTCCDRRSSRLTPSSSAGDCGRFTAAWCCWSRYCSELTTCPCCAAACSSRPSWPSSSGRSSTTTRLRPPSCITGSVRPSSSFR